MAEQCIVCLGDLRELTATEGSTDLPEAAEARALADAGDDTARQHHAKNLLRDTRLSTKRYPFPNNPIRSSAHAHVMR